MKVDVLAVGVERGAFQLLLLTRFDPKTAGLSNRHAFVWRSVDALGDFDGDNGAKRVSVLFAIEGSNVAIALAVDIVDDPSLFGLPPFRDPSSITDRHGPPFKNQLCRSMSQ